MSLYTKPNIADADYFYELLVNAQLGLSDKQVLAVYSKIILLLSNHIGEIDVLKEAFAIARKETEENNTAEA